MMNPPTKTVEPYERTTLWRTEDSAVDAANTITWEPNPTAYGAADHLPHLQTTTRRWKWSAWLTAIMVGIALLRLISHLVGAGSSADAGWGVHVCAVYDYSSSDAQCSHDDPAITLAGGSSSPRLSISGVNGANFSGAPITFTIKVQDDSGRTVAQGTVTRDVSTTDNVGALPLDSALLSAGIGSDLVGAYRIDVREGATNLGSASFTVIGISSYGE